MTKYKRIGIIVILIGFCIPIISFAFADGYNPKLGFWWSISKMNISLWEKTVKTDPEIKIDFIPQKDSMHLIPAEEVIDDEAIVLLPYKYPFSLGLIFVFSGLGIIVLTKQKKYD